MARSDVTMSPLPDRFCWTPAASSEVTRVDEVSPRKRKEAQSSTESVRLTCARIIALSAIE